MKLKLTQKESKDAVTKKVWTLDDFETVEDLMTAIVDQGDEGMKLVNESFWTGFKLVTRNKKGFDEALNKLKIKFTVTNETVTKSKESDEAVLARLLGVPVETITPDYIAMMSKKTNS